MSNPSDLILGGWGVIKLFSKIAEYPPWLRSEEVPFIWRDYLDDGTEHVVKRMVKLPGSRYVQFQVEYDPERKDLAKVVAVAVHRNE